MDPEPCRRPWRIWSPPDLLLLDAGEEAEGETVGGFTAAVGGGGGRSPRARSPAAAAMWVGIGRRGRGRKRTEEE